MAFNDVLVQLDKVQGVALEIMSHRVTNVFRAEDLTDERHQAARDKVRTVIGLQVIPYIRTHGTLVAVMNAIAAKAQNAGDPLYEDLHKWLALAFISVWSWGNRIDDLHRLTSDSRRAEKELGMCAKLFGATAGNYLTDSATEPDLGEPSRSYSVGGEISW